MAFEVMWSRFEDNEDSWFSLWCEARETGCALLLLNGELSDDSLFNHITRVRCKTEEADDIIEQTILRFGEKSIPPCFYVSPLTSPEDFGERLEDKGFRQWDKMDVMEYLGEEPDLQEGDVEVRRVDSESINLWTAVYAESFEVSKSQTQEYTKRTGLAFLRSDTDFFLAFVDGKVAGCASLYSKDRVGGIYFLGILAEFRRRGIASKLLKVVAKRSEERHNTSLILQTLRQSGLKEFYSKNRFKKTYTKSIYILK